MLTYLKSAIQNPQSKHSAFRILFSSFQCFESHAFYQNPNHFPPVPGEAPDAVSDS